MVKMVERRARVASLGEGEFRGHRVLSGAAGAQFVCGRMGLRE